jgi:quinol monooxygenase YgiN
MAKPEGKGMIRQLARYQVRPEGLEKSLAAIRKFVSYVRSNEPGTLRYEVWQEREDPTRFVHIFVFRDAEADRAHSESREVKEFAAVLYPECLKPVEFIDYHLVTSNI